ncbi:MAG: LptF/LptG family permease, partial [Planctomycetota bacterium]
ILSLGSILQPIQEYGIGPRQVLHMMGYFLPITLTFVLPMAALFAGSLVYGRFASDNEFDACRATGISVWTLVYPGLALAIIVATANLFLSFYVMPVFVHRAEESLKADAKQILFRNIQRRRYYELPPDERYVIYADQANLQNDMLSGVILMDMENNEITDITTAEAAKISFNPQDTFNEVHITADRPSRMGAEGAGGAEQTAFALEFGSLLGDEIKFKKIDEMKRIKANPLRFYPIEKLARDSYAQLTIELLAQHINSKTGGAAKRGETPSAAGDDVASFYELIGEPNSVRFAADQYNLQGDQVGLSGGIEVVEYHTEGKLPSRNFTCADASLHLDLEDDPLAPSLTMDLRSVQEQGSAEIDMRYVISGLTMPQAVEVKANKFRTEYGSPKVDELAWQLQELSGLKPSQKLQGLQNRLQRQMRKTSVEIKAEIHSRLVFGTGCVPMILIGIGLGIIKRGGHLLSAFGASCVPAAVLIVCIMSGKQITENLTADTFSGVAMMWTGLGFLTLVTIVIYGWLLRN